MPGKAQAVRSATRMRRFFIWQVAKPDKLFPFPIETKTRSLKIIIMASCDGREDNDGRGWQDNDWRDVLTSEQEQEDALFKSLDEDELEDASDELFFTQSMDVPLDLVERLSWDAASQDSSDDDEGTLAPGLPKLLPLQIGIAFEDNNLQWGLISPCSETSSPRPSLSTTLSPLLRVSISSPVCQRRFFRPEPEHEATGEQVKASTQQMIQEEGQEVEEQEQEQEEEQGRSLDVNSVLSSPVTRRSANPFATYQTAETHTRSTDNIISDSHSDEDNQQSPVVPVIRLSLLPRAPSIAHWRRQKARTCSGAGLAGTPTALYPDTLKASLSRLRNRSVDDADDGDFSSDDEGYTPELHRCRASETESLDTSQWRRARHMSISFPSHRLSISPTVMTKRLQQVKDKLNGGLNLLRSGSNVSTVMSEVSYLESPEIKSDPAGTYREPSIFSDDATATSVVSAASACTIDSDTHHPTRQQQLRAGVFRAAGLLNAASAEAARKLKSRGFRAPHLSRQNAASETEEEDPELPSTYPAASDHCGALEP